MKNIKQANESTVLFVHAAKVWLTVAFSPFSFPKFGQKLLSLIIITSREIIK